MSERDRNLDAPIIPAAPVIGAPMMTPGLVEDEPGDEIDNEVVAEERDRDLIEDDSELLDPNSPEFDHSLHRRTSD